jgi:hypothetical protein
MDSLPEEEPYSPSAVTLPKTMVVERVMGAFSHLAASRNHAGTRRQLDSESYRRRENQYRRILQQ